MNFKPPSLVISAATPRSGSTWLQRIVHAATDIFVWGEPFPLVESLTHVYSEFKRHDLVRSQEREDLLSSGEDPTVWAANANPPIDNLKRAMRSLFAVFYETHGRPRYGWKEVHYGRQELEFLWELFPELKVILLVRHPVMVIRSLRSLGWIGEGRFIESVDVACDWWADHVRDYLCLRQRENVLFLKYEEVPDRMQDLMAFVGGELNEQARKALSAVVGSSDRGWELTEDDLRTLLDKCGEGMDALGYAMQIEHQPAAQVIAVRSPVPDHDPPATARV